MIASSAIEMVTAPIVRPAAVPAREAPPVNGAASTPPTASTIPPTFIRFFFLRRFLICSAISPVQTIFFSPASRAAVSSLVFETVFILNLFIS